MKEKSKKKKIHKGQLYCINGKTKCIPDEYKNNLHETTKRKQSNEKKNPMHE